MNLKCNKSLSVTFIRYKHIHRQRQTFQGRILNDMIIEELSESYFSNTIADCAAFFFKDVVATAYRHTEGVFTRNGVLF
jgi:hypothetical protein